MGLLRAKFLNTFNLNAQLDRGCSMAHSTKRNTRIFINMMITDSIALALTTSVLERSPSQPFVCERNVVPRLNHTNVEHGSPMITVANVHISRASVINVARPEGVRMSWQHSPMETSNEEHVDLGLNLSTAAPFPPVPANQSPNRLYRNVNRHACNISALQCHPKTSLADSGTC